MSEAYQEYTVKQGEGLMAIARHLYGDPNKYKEFRNANGGPIANPDRIMAGEKILIPKRGSTQAYDEYIVKQGEGLMAISRRLYGDPNKYKEFRNANGGPIADPDRIKAGEKILIPKQGQSQAYDEYIVKQGEGLMAISRRLYGDPHKYKQFLNAHGAPIADPDRIKAGEKILIPKAGRL